MGIGYISVLFDVGDLDTVRVVGHVKPKPPDAGAIVAYTTVVEDVDAVLEKIRETLSPFARPEPDRFRVRAVAVARLIARIAERPEAQAARAPRYRAS